MPVCGASAADSHRPVTGVEETTLIMPRVGILPVYLHGTYAAMPKGTTIIKNRDVGARIGRLLSFEELDELTKGMARAEAYRLIAALLRHEVENLRDRTRHAFDAKGVRKQWKAERRAQMTDEASVSMAQ